MWHDLGVSRIGERGSKVKSGMSALGLRVQGLFSEEARFEAMVGPPGLWQHMRDFQMSFLMSEGLEPTMSLLDLGCGPLRGGLPLIRFLECGKYTGLDVRASVIEVAYGQLAKNKLADKNPTLVVSSSFGKDELGTREFDIVWAMSVLFHLGDDLVRDFLRNLRPRVQKGCIYANVNVDTSPIRAQWLEFPFMQRPLSFYEDMAASVGLGVTVLGQLHELGFSANTAGRDGYMLAFRPAETPRASKRSVPRPPNVERHWA